MHTPALNPISVTLFSINASVAIKHPYRNRYLNKDTDYTEVCTIMAQAHFFSKESLRRRDEQSSLRTLGYLWFDFNDAKVKGIYPHEESWVGFRIRIDDLGEHLYEITECVPKCHLRGGWLYMRANIEEAWMEDPKDTTEKTEERAPESRLFSSVEQEQEIYP